MRMSPIQSRVQTPRTVAVTTADTVLAAENVSILKRTIYNDTAAILYVKMGVAGASSTSKSFNVAAGGYFEVYDSTAPIYGALATGTGNVMVTDYF